MDATNSHLPVAVREITDEEVGFYQLDEIAYPIIYQLSNYLPVPRKRSAGER